MKKFFLVMICALLMIVFIAFNYLLWDRENKEKNIQSLEVSNASNNASITALGREIKLLEDENASLKTRISEMERANRSLADTAARLEQEKSRESEQSALKDAVIDSLKKDIDVKILEAPVRKWIEAMDSGEYEKAYNLLDRPLTQKMGIAGLADYEAASRAELKSIKLKSLKLASGENEKTEQKKYTVLINAVLDVKTAGAGDKGKLGFSDGANERTFTVDYSLSLKSWIIVDIASR